MRLVYPPLFFLGLGLILALAVPGQILGIQIHTIGWIIAAIAALAAIGAFVAANSKSRSATVQSVDPTTGSSRTEHVSDAPADPTI